VAARLTGWTLLAFRDGIFVLIFAAKTERRDTRDIAGEGLA
jgi:hypothetical protein